MSLDVLVTGRLRGAPLLKKSVQGKPYTTFRLAVPDKAGESRLVRCIAFSATVCEAVRTLEDGDAVAVAGEAQITTWHGNDGATHCGLDVTAHQVMSPYHAGRKRGARTTEGATPADADTGAA